MMEIVSVVVVRTRTKIEVSPRSTTFAQLCQPCAEANREPFAQVKRLEENPFDALQRRAERFYYTDFGRPISDGSDGHKLNT